MHALSRLTMQGGNLDGYINKFEALCADAVQSAEDKMRRFRAGLTHALQQDTRVHPSGRAFESYEELRDLTVRYHSYRPAEVLQGGAGSGKRGRDTTDAPRGDTYAAKVAKRGERPAAVNGKGKGKAAAVPARQPAAGAGAVMSGLFRYRVKGREYSVDRAKHAELMGKRVCFHCGNGGHNYVDCTRPPAAWVESGSR